MNESTQTQLKILVERAVRPVHAGLARKRKMREELLAHVTEAFQQETARLADEPAALQQTALRFGNPAELSIKLQESVPLKGRIRGAMSQFLFRRDESWLRRGFRNFAWIQSLLLVLIALLCLCDRGLTGIWPPSLSSRMGLEIAYVLFAVLSFTAIGNWLRWPSKGVYGISKSRCLLFIPWLIVFAIWRGMDLFGAPFVYGFFAADLALDWTSRLREPDDDEWGRLQIS